MRWRRSSDLGDSGCVSTMPPRTALNREVISEDFIIANNTHSDRTSEGSAPQLCATYLPASALFATVNACPIRPSAPSASSLAGASSRHVRLSRSVFGPIGATIVLFCPIAPPMQGVLHRLQELQHRRWLPSCHVGHRITAERHFHTMYRKTSQPFQPCHVSTAKRAREWARRGVGCA